jgi:signal transduction histidine kinase
MPELRPSLANRLRASAAPLLLCACAAALVAGVWHATLSRIDEGRARLLSDATRDAASLARLVEEHSARTIQSADQALQFLKYAYAAEGRSLDLAGLVRHNVVLGDLFSLCSIIGPHGEVLLSSLPFPPATSVIDREHFLVQRDHRDAGLFISKPLMGRVTQKWLIQLTRRLEGADGQFAGVAVVSMDPFYFTRLYESAHLGPHSAVSLVGDDGIIRARRSGGLNEIGLDVSQSPMFKVVTSNQSGTFARRSTLDGRDRVYAFRRIGHYPLRVVVGLDTADVLDEYEPLKDKLIQQALLVTLAIALFTGLLLVLIRRLVQRRAQALSASAAKTQFLSNMSHELRTPLNGILGYAELLRDDLPPGEPREFAQIIHDSGTHLLALVNQILQLNKIEAGKERVTLEPVDLHHLLGQMVNAHRSSAQAKGLALRCEIAPATPRHIQCDRIKLMQVLNNLLHNAVKFTERGSVVLSLAPWDAGLRFEVRDTGPGIPDEVQQLVFEKFFQVDAHAARRNDGTGLGLALVRELVELMDGQVRLESQTGAGTSFSFTLPALPVDTTGEQEAA